MSRQLASIIGKLLVTLIVIAVCAPVPQALAHDFWIEPSAFLPQLGETVRLSLKVGEGFVGTTQPFIPAWFSDYRIVLPSGNSNDVMAMVGDDPAGAFVPEEDGLYLIGYRSGRSFVELEPMRFRKYLKLEGMEFIEEQRAALGESGQTAKEFYSRCVKSLVLAGADPGTAGGFDRVLGYTLELVPERNPFALDGQALPVVLAYEGSPLEGALVVAYSRENPDEKIAARTDAQGRVRLPIPGPGVWLVKAVHMVQAPPDTKARWESFWAALTFEIPN